jgi:lysozyme
VILGVDVWDGYGKIDWGRAAAAGVKFAIVKHTEGNEGCDRRALENVSGCKAAGIYVGAYLYGMALPSGRNRPPGRSPEEQARKLWTDSGGLGTRPGELPPVLDIEFPARWDKRKKNADGSLADQWRRWEVDALFIASWTLACLAEIERLWKRTPIVYTYPDFWRSLGGHGAHPSFSRYPLWIANYTHPDAWMPPETARPIAVQPWPDYVMWQFSADGSPIRIPGIPACPIDRNVFNGSLDDLRRLAGIDPSADTIPPLPVLEADELDEDDQTRTYDMATFDIVHPKVPLRGDPPDEPDPAA